VQVVVSSDRTVWHRAMSMLRDWEVPKWPVAQVDIGTTTPIATLEVHGATKLNGNITIGSAGNPIAAMGYCIYSYTVNGSSNISFSSCSPGNLPTSSNVIVMCSSFGSSSLPLACQAQGTTPPLTIACSAATNIPSGSTIRCLWMQP
jgi:hypothetical protein